MSVWAPGVWAPGVWAAGVWFEDAPAPVATGSAVFTAGWAHVSRPRTKEEVRKARERFGISDDRVPVKVCKVIAQVAKQKVAEPDLGLDAALHRALERKALAYRAVYAEVLRQHIEELKQEDEEILVLLMH